MLFILSSDSLPTIISTHHHLCSPSSLLTIISTLTPSPLPSDFIPYLLNGLLGFCHLPICQSAIYLPRSRQQATRDRIASARIRTSDTRPSVFAFKGRLAPSLAPSLALFPSTRSPHALHRIFTSCSFHPSAFFHSYTHVSTLFTCTIFLSLDALRISPSNGHLESTLAHTRTGKANSFPPSAIVPNQAVITASDKLNRSGQTYLYLCTPTLIDKAVDARQVSSIVAVHLQLASPSAQHA